MHSELLLYDAIQINLNLNLNTDWRPHAYFHFVVPLLLRSWQSLAGCSAAAPTGKTGVPESGLGPGEHCSGWLLCQVYGESWAGLQMQGCTHH